MDDHEIGSERFGGTEPPLPGGGPRTGPEWERSGYSIDSYIRTVRQVLLEPTPFFTGMRREGGLGPPLVFGLTGFTLGLMFGAILQTSLSRMPFGMFPTGLQDMAADVGVLILLLILMPFMVLLSLFLSSALYHLMLMLVGGARHSFETTFRVVCYSAGSTGLIHIVPVCGGLIAAVWQIVASIIGLSKAHEISTGRAAAAVLLPVILCCATIAFTIGAILAMIAAWGGALSRI